MELFALSQDVAALEASLFSLEGKSRLSVLIALAWALRQRDCQRTIVLADEAEALLNQDAIDGVELQVEVRLQMARLLLIRGEVSWLFADLDLAETQAKHAMKIFLRLENYLGAGDAKWLMASIWLDRGNVQSHGEWLELAIEDYRGGGDVLRVAIGTARSLHFAAFFDGPATSMRIAQLFDSTRPHPPAVMAWLGSAIALVTGLGNNQASAIKGFSQAHLAAIESGQLRQAILNASNGADAFATLGDLDAALEWDELALGLARKAGWPSMIGNTLMQTGNVLRLLGRYSEAKAALREAKLMMQGLTSSKSFTMALQYLGDLALSAGDPEAALDHFRQVEDRLTVNGEAYFLLRCWRGQANALCRLAQPHAAMAKVAAVLELARGGNSADEEINALRIYAELYLQYPLPAPVGMRAASGALHYLTQALAVAATIEGYTLPSDLLDEVACAYAAAGDYQQAYLNSRAAADARDNKRLVDARHRAVAMQVRQETERAQAEAQHHRQRSVNDAKRNAALQEAISTLEILGLVGRELTACLDAEAVFATFYRHTKQLLKVTSFSISLIDQSSQLLQGTFCIEKGERFTLASVAIDHPIAHIARCARERKEINVDMTQASSGVDLIPGAIGSLSLLFLPLLIGDRLLGVMAIQSNVAKAYGERECAIFRTLCAYGAIALDNAGAYSLAESAQRKASSALVELGEARKKLADHAEWLAEEVSKATNEISQRERETVFRLSKAAEYRDRETGAHILRMAHYSQLIARGLGLSVADQELILEAAPMHDIGKVGITDNILLMPGKLNGDEFEMMKQHALYGYEILKESSSQILQAGAAIARGHHEKFDGSGYPYGLMGEDIPIFSRIVAVADVFDALTSERPYKKAWTLDAAADFLSANAGTHFDPACVITFFDHWDEVLLIRERFKDHH
jgi:HD-GYP domain-containing protein (c-di-GMP phosphodiesterase class II)